MFMAKLRKSYLSNLLGNYTYEEFKEYSKYIVSIGSGIIVFLLALSHFFHYGLLSYLLNLTLGFSLLFIAYIVAWTLFLDYRVEVDEPERMPWEEPVEFAKPIRYRLTIIWAILLVVIGLFAIIFSNKFKNQYSFECDTFLVDSQAGIYHYEWNEDCEKAENAEELVKMKGYEIDKQFHLCDYCEEAEKDLRP